MIDMWLKLEPSAEMNLEGKMLVNVGYSYKIERDGSVTYIYLRDLPAVMVLDTPEEIMEMMENYMQ